MHEEKHEYFPRILQEQIHAFYLKTYLKCGHSKVCQSLNTKLLCKQVSKHLCMGKTYK